MRQFLIVKTSSIGDVIQSLHLIDHLKARFVGCAVDWVAEKESASLLRAHPHLRRALEVDTRLWRKGLVRHRAAILQFVQTLRKTRYDALFDVQGNTKSAIITALARARKKVGFSWKGLAEKTNFFATNVHVRGRSGLSVRQSYSQLLLDFFGDKALLKQAPVHFSLTLEEESELERLAQRGSSGVRLMVCFGSNWRNKRLKEKTLTAFLQKIYDASSPSFLFVWKDEVERACAERLEQVFPSSWAIGDLSLPLLQRFMSLVDGVIAMDSAALHLCATTSTPSFGCFGPTLARAYNPSGDQHGAFQGGCPYGITFDRRCPHLRTCHTGACLREVTAEALFDQFHSFWERVLSLAPA